MRFTLLFIALAGCVAMSEIPDPPPTDIPAPAAKCDPDAYKPMHGQHVDVLKGKLPKLHRVLTPTTMMTMDHRPNRLNIMVDENGRITGAYCG